MHSTPRLFVVAALTISAVSIGGCGAASLQNQPEPSPPGPTIGHLQLRDRKVTLYATPEGTRFTVRATDGRVVAHNLTAGDLRAQHPALFEAFQTGLASGTAPSGIDATLTLPGERDDDDARRPR